jgi:hypothetical protein
MPNVEKSQLLDSRDSELVSHISSVRRLEKLRLFALAHRPQTLAFNLLSRRS